MSAKIGEQTFEGRRENLSQAPSASRRRARCQLRTALMRPTLRHVVPRPKIGSVGRPITGSAGERDQKIVARRRPAARSDAVVDGVLTAEIDRRGRARPVPELSSTTGAPCGARTDGGPSVLGHQHGSFGIAGGGTNSIAVMARSTAADAVLGRSATDQQWGTRAKRQRQRRRRHEYCRATVRDTAKAARVCRLSRL
jgi:hypothetical protein